MRFVHRSRPLLYRTIETTNIFTFLATKSIKISVYAVGCPQKYMKATTKGEAGWKYVLVHNALAH
jgi:hypothetical protein